jgi:hypothetical protein
MEVLFDSFNLSLSVVFCSRKIFSCLLFDFFLVVLGFELRALYLLGRYKATWAMPPPFFGSSYFWDRVILNFAVWQWSSYFRLPTIDGMTGAHHHAKLFLCLLRWGLANFFPLDLSLHVAGWQVHITTIAWESSLMIWPWITVLPISASQVTRITSVSHCCPAFCFLNMGRTVVLSTV